MSLIYFVPPRFRRENPLNLSISVSGGKESKSDSLSSGERKGTKAQRITSRATRPAAECCVKGMSQFPREALLNAHSTHLLSNS